MKLPDKPINTIDVSRRQLLATTGTVVAGGSAVVWQSTREATAAVNTTEIDIPTTTVESPDGEVDAVQATVTGNYEYEINDADTLTLELLVAPPEGSFAPIDSVEESLSTMSGAGSYTLTGDVLAHNDITTELFYAAPEETTTVVLPVRVGLTVTMAGDTVVEALAEGAAEVTVESGEIVASAAVLGEGEIVVEV
jgi:hypothetical protein